MDLATDHAAAGELANSLERARREEQAAVGALLARASRIADDPELARAFHAEVFERARALVRVNAFAEALVLLRAGMRLAGDDESLKRAYRGEMVRANTAFGYRGSMRRSFDRSVRRTHAPPGRMIPIPVARLLDLQQKIGLVEQGMRRDVIAQLPGWHIVRTRGKTEGTAESARAGETTYEIRSKVSGDETFAAVRVTVSFDETGGAGSGANRATGPPRFSDGATELRPKVGGFGDD